MVAPFDVLAANLMSRAHSEVECGFRLDSAGTVLRKEVGKHVIF